MALVAYDYGSESEPEITDNEMEVTNAETASGQLSSTTISNNLFSKLPSAKSQTSTQVEENDQLEDFIPTVKNIKEKKKVLITIPSLSEFNDLKNDEPARKRAKASAKGSGLLGMLPPVQAAPKSSTMFVPNIVAKKSTKGPLTPTQVTKKTGTVSKKMAPVRQSKPESGSDTDTDSEDIVIPETFDDKMWEKVCGRPKVPKRIPKTQVLLQLEPPAEFSTAPEPDKPYDGLNNVAFKELIGKVKKPMGNIKLIDINEEEIMPDKDLWMTKSLTDPELQPKAAPEDVLDPTKKRKHHITYLAQQAKANEQEYKAAWATSKNNRMMSRAKYGF
ncbi:proline-rich protein PRCC isoform X2 [Euwallacea similis]|uniref:proline-rich protein PRCC isoform X2 n=1 Tax=Euwallacea similis TaxID=1736056 RepID=UPI00344C3AFA